MARSAQQRFNTYLDESQDTASVVEQFSKSCRQSEHGYAYEAGWWNSMVPRILMALPKTRRQEFLQELRTQSHKLDAENLVSVLINGGHR